MRVPQLAWLLAAALAAGCATTTVNNPVSGRAERTVMDEASELTEGRKAHEEVLKETPPVANPALQAYVNGVGQRLAAQSHRPGLQWTFTVLDSPEVNAFALPGGFVYITRGIMAYLDSEADMAGVIGHEIGHVTARHGAQRATRQQSAGLGVLAASVLGAVLESRGLGGVGQLAGQLGQAAAAGYVARYSREQELQADQLGAEYLARAKFDPKNMVDVIQVLKDQDQFRADQVRAAGRTPQGHNDWLASHPSSEERLRQIAQRAQGHPGPFSDDGKARYLKAIDGLTFGDSREQGLTRGQNFYHEPLGIALTAPPRWAVQNGAEAIQIVNAEADAALIVRLVPADAGSTHEEIIRKLFKPEQGRIEPYTLPSGLRASHFTGARRNAQGQLTNIELTVVSGPNGSNYLLGYAAKDANALQRARPGLRDAEASFRPLSSGDRAAARPWALRSVPYPSGGFAQLARNSPLGTQAESTLKLINGAYGGKLPAPGQLVKVVDAQ